MTFNSSPPVRVKQATTSLGVRLENADPLLPQGLRYSHDRGAGIRRFRAGKGMHYKDAGGRPVRDAATLARIKTLVIPPAWTDVWICPWPNGHIQATGRDVRGRKQYRYHNGWRTARDASKYERTVAFGRALSKIRRVTDRDLKRSGLPERKVLAALVRLLETTLIRVGNTEYARDNRSFGLTTMRDGHATLFGGTIQFKFRGKSGIHHAISLNDRRLARVVKQCQELPGQELFQYVDETGQVCDVKSDDVNNYLHEIAGEEFTAKDFRTWAGTVLAVIALREFEAFDSKTSAKKNIVRAIESVAKRLGNTPSVCRKCYIHPVVLDAYLDGSMLDSLRQKTTDELADMRGLTSEEVAVLVLLERRLAEEAKHDRSKVRSTHSKAKRRPAHRPRQPSSP
jgi:DNA topoisomerase I